MNDALVMAWHRQLQDEDSAIVLTDGRKGAILITETANGTITFAGQRSYPS